jgi:hypothetical protein
MDHLFHEKPLVGLTSTHETIRFLRREVRSVRKARDAQDDLSVYRPGKGVPIAGLAAAPANGLISEYTPRKPPVETDRPAALDTHACRR